MKTKTLQQKLNLISKIIKKKNTLPVLDHILFKNGKMIVSDMENYLVIDHPGYTGENMLLNYQQLKDFLKSIKENYEITFEVQKDNIILKCINGGQEPRVLFQKSFDKHDTKEYPALPFEIINKCLSTDELVNSDINNVVDAKLFISTDTTRLPLMRVYIDEINIVATDAHRLFMSKRSYPGNDTFNYLIHKEVIPLLKGYDKITINKLNINDSDYLQFVTVDYILYHRQDDGLNYPDWKKVIPDECTLLCEVTFNTQDLLRNCNILKNINASTHQGTFTYDIANKEVTINSTDSDLKNESSSKQNVRFQFATTEDYPETSLQIGLNLKLLGEYLSLCKGVSVTQKIYGNLRYKRDENEKQVVDGCDYTRYFSNGSVFNDEYLLMPVKIDD